MVYAVVRIRGNTNVRRGTLDTLRMLHLDRVNHATLIPQRMEGMLRRVKDYVAYGPIQAPAIESLLRKRGRVEGGDRLTEEWLQKNTPYKTIPDLARALAEEKTTLAQVQKLKPLFRLHPARGGLGELGTKKTKPEGGVLGNWGTGITELLEQMR